MPPTPQALHDVLTLMGTIAGMGLSADESTSLITKTRDVGKKLIDHQAYQACKKLGDLQQQINVDVLKGGKLTMPQAATLTAAVSAIGAELGC